ncbi:MAG: DinB family protein [Acidobacteriota bacterium]
MEFKLDDAVALLAKTPAVLRAMLDQLSPQWTSNNEGANTWSPFDMLGHLIHGERTDWIPRAKIILEFGENRAFDVFDRFAQFEDSHGKATRDLLAEFESLRQSNLTALKEMNLSEADLRKTGTHPELGLVTMEQLLATWVAHDLSHIAQVSRTMAKQYTEAVGPWRAYLSVLK